MFDISWLAQHRLTSIVNHEFYWDFIFTDNVMLRAECLWRLLEEGRIRITSEDHAQKFGLPAPVDCAFELNKRITGIRVSSVSIRDGTLDLTVKFESGHVLELVPSSAGYEAWQIGGNGSLVIAVGGGRLDVFTDPKVHG